MESLDKKEQPGGNYDYSCRLFYYKAVRTAIQECLKEIINNLCKEKIEDKYKESCWDRIHQETIFNELNNTFTKHFGKLAEQEKEE